MASQEQSENLFITSSEKSDEVQAEEDLEVASSVPGQEDENFAVDPDQDTIVPAKPKSKKDAAAAAAPSTRRPSVSTVVMNINFVATTDTADWMVGDAKLMTPTERVITNNLTVLAEQFDELKKMMISMIK